MTRHMHLCSRARPGRSHRGVLWQNLLAGLTWLAGAALPAQADMQEPTPAVRVMPIGDSITQGRRGNGVAGDAAGPTQSWRYPFWRALRARGAAVDLVGAIHGGLDGNPEWPALEGVPFDDEHESRWGYRLDMMNQVLREDLERVQADVALVLLGSNDLGAGESLAQVFAEWDELIALLRAHNPDIVIVVAPPCADFEHKISEYGRALIEHVPHWSTPQSPVVAANACDGWISDPRRKGAHTVDWIHPNARGDQKIAEAFLRAAEPWLIGACGIDQSAEPEHECQL